MGPLRWRLQARYREKYNHLKDIKAPEVNLPVESLFESWEQESCPGEPQIVEFEESLVTDLTYALDAECGSLETKE